MTKPTTAHTPWQHGYAGSLRNVLDADGVVVAVFSMPEDAGLAVASVNHAEALASALELMLRCRDGEMGRNTTAPCSWYAAECESRAALKAWRDANG